MYATTKMEKNHPQLLPNDQTVVPVGTRLDPSQVQAAQKNAYLASHIAQLASVPSTENIHKLLNFLDNPNIAVRKMLCQHLHDLSQTVSDEKQQALLKEGLHLLQKDENPIIRLYLAQLTRK
jgi:hypothetical protein